LERNPEYWAADKTGRRLPYFDEVMFAEGGGPGTEAILFLNGKCDAYETVAPENLEQFKKSAISGRFQIVELGAGTERDFFWFNQNTGTNAAGLPFVSPVKLAWFRNKQFRQAISCAIDRERMAYEVYQGRAQPIYGFISAENQKWNNPNVPRFSFDVAKARALFAGAGFQDRDGDGVLEDSNGTPVEILFYSNSGNPAREKAAALIQEILKA
jgi:peptide/nickel transport system substrate-binding protein